MRIISRFLVAGALAALTTVAHAADIRPMPQQSHSYQLPPQRVELFNWTGFYAGGLLNYVHADDCSGQTGTFWGFSLSGDCGGKGFGGGLSAMALYQPPGSQWGVGGRVMYEWLNADGGSAITLQGPAWCGFCGPLAGTRFSGGLDRSLTLSGLLLYVPQRRTALYLHGGWKRSSGEAQASAFGTTIKDSKTHNGWEAGIGVMQDFGYNISGFLEYAYAEHGAKTYFGSTVPTQFDPGDSHTVRFGLHYKFGT